MVDKSDIEQFIIDAVTALQFFQTPDPSIIELPLTNEFIDAGFALLEHYQSTKDTVVNDQIIGYYVDCAMFMSTMAGNSNISANQRQLAEEMTMGIEDLVNAITRAVEQNINAKR